MKELLDFFHYLDILLPSEFLILISNLTNEINGYSFGVESPRTANPMEISLSFLGQI